MILTLLKSRFADAFRGITDDPAPLLDMIKSSQDPKFGDYQANCAMPLGKKLGQPPRQIAAQIVQQLDIADFCEPPEIAGPGFINLRLKEDWLAAQVNAILDDDRLGVSAVAEPRHVIVDYSSPNVAKPMHVGHLRSSVIGDAICRILRFAGHKVTSDNHIGDWGTQFGMIIYGYKHFVDPSGYEEDPVGELARLYRLVNQVSDYHAAVGKLPDLEARLESARRDLADAEAAGEPADKSEKKQRKVLRKSVATLEETVATTKRQIGRVDSSPVVAAAAYEHPDIARLARLETSKLHAGDEENLRLWNEFLPECLKALNSVYERLDVSFDLTLGESFYNPMLADVVSSLQEQGLAKESDGAQCVFVDGNDAPFIVQKSDGAYTYATTDLATIRYRVSELSADEILYVVDKRQSEHFALLFETCRLWGFDNLKCQHVSFGTVMGDDNKPFKTRSGDNVGLESLIDEAVGRAGSVVAENDDLRDHPLLDDESRANVSDVVGVGGIKYADLHHNRDSDYKFSWDKMLAATGDSATYMQYAFARICGIFRREGTTREQVRKAAVPLLITAPQERALVLQLLSFGEAIEVSLADYRPNILCDWLLSTADKYSQFFANCPVLKADTDELKASRLSLCELTARALEVGLSLLGIKTAEVL